MQQKDQPSSFPIFKIQFGDVTHLLKNKTKPTIRVWSCLHSEVWARHSDSVIDIQSASTRDPASETLVVRCDPFQYNPVAGEFLRTPAVRSRYSGAIKWIIAFFRRFHPPHHLVSSTSDNGDECALYMTSRRDMQMFLAAVCLFIAQYYPGDGDESGSGEEYAKDVSHIDRSIASLSETIGDKDVISHAIKLVSDCKHRQRTIEDTCDLFCWMIKFPAIQAWRFLHYQHAVPLPSEPAMRKGKYTMKFMPWYELTILIQDFWTFQKEGEQGEKRYMKTVDANPMRRLVVHLMRILLSDRTRYEYAFWFRRQQRRTNDESDQMQVVEDTTEASSSSSSSAPDASSSSSQASQSTQIIEPFDVNQLEHVSMLTEGEHAHLDQMNVDDLPMDDMPVQEELSGDDPRIRFDHNVLHAYHGNDQHMMHMNSDLMQYEPTRIAEPHQPHSTIQEDGMHGFMHAGESLVQPSYHTAMSAPSSHYSYRELNHISAPVHPAASFAEHHDDSSLQSSFLFGPPPSLAAYRRLYYNQEDRYHSSLSLPSFGSRMIGVDI